MAVPRALARDDDAPDADLRAVGQVGQVGAGGDPARRQAFAQEAQGMAVDGEAGRRVVGDHRVPIVERGQRGRRGQLEPERELRAPRARRVGGRGGAQAPQRRPAPTGKAVTGARPCQLGQRRATRARARGEVVERAEGTVGLAGGDERGDLVAAHAEDVAEAEADGGARRGGGRAHGQRRGRCGGCGDEDRLARRARAEGQDLRRDVDDGAPGRAGVDVGREDLDAAALGLVDEGVGRIEAHRLLVEQRAQELRPIVDAQPGGLVGEQAEGGPVGLGEAEAREADHHRPHALGQRLVDVGPLVHRPLDEAAVVDSIASAERFAAHRTAQALGLARREAREGHRDLDDLVLEDDRPQRVAQDGLERGVLVGDRVVGLHAQAWRRSM